MFKVNREKCTGCGICVNACPFGAISMVDGKARIDNDKCTDCGNCIQVCPLNAIYSDADYNEKPRQSFPQGQSQAFPPPRSGSGMGRGSGRGMGRGLGRGPHDGRGSGRGGGGRRW
jgi:Fe-S-cluster-containing hydrogenase component 2